MGCCISKCQPEPNPKPKPKPKHDSNNPSVQDKLVISQSPPSTPPSPPRKRKTIQSPPSITSVSLTCSTQANTCCSSTLSSASSSSSVALFSKVDRSFSNDFLHSCAMENPQIVGLDHHVKKSEVKKLSPGTTQKRARASSPTITRQKSFRVEKEKPLNTSIVNGKNYTVRSPSPSRRFNTYTSSHQRNHTMRSPSPSRRFKDTYNESNRIVKANSRPNSPYRNVINKELRPVYLKNNKDRFGYEVGSKVEGVGVGQVLSKVDYSEAVPMEEDLDNPHIALDCFIFL